MKIVFRIQKMIYEGLLKRIAIKFWPNMDDGKKLGFDAIEIKQVIQVHILLLAGYFISTLFLLLEAVLAKNRRRRKRRFRIIQTVPPFNNLEFWQ